MDSLTTFRPSIVAAFDVQDTPSARKIINAVFKKYPQAGIACFGDENKHQIRSIVDAIPHKPVGIFTYMHKDMAFIMRKRVLGVVCGSEKAFGPEVKVMRCQ